MWTQNKAQSRCVRPWCGVKVVVDGWHQCTLTRLACHMQASSRGLVGEDAAYFDAQQQSAPKWAFFTAELAVVLGIMYVVGDEDNMQTKPLLLLANAMWRSRCCIWTPMHKLPARDSWAPMHRSG